MKMLQRPSFGAPMAIIYITVGALIGVWSSIWYFYLHNNTPLDDSSYYLCTGSLLTGLVLIVIGLTSGRLAGSRDRPNIVPDSCPTNPR
jgi:hypothetical protein